MSIEAMKQALEALELARSTHDVMLLSDPPQRAWKYHGVDWKLLSAVQHLRQAIAEAEKQKPLCTAAMFDEWFLAKSGLDPKTPLYTHPQPKRECDMGVMCIECPDAQPKREPLTDEQILADETLRYHFGMNGGAGPVSRKGRAVIAAIEAAHGIKAD